MLGPFYPRGPTPVGKFGVVWADSDWRTLYNSLTEKIKIMRMHLYTCIVTFALRRRV